MTGDLFGEASLPAGAEILTTPAALAMAAAGAPVTAGPVHVSIPVVAADAGAETAHEGAKTVAPDVSATCGDVENQPLQTLVPDRAPLPSQERVREVLAAHGVLAPDAAGDDLAAGLVPALAQLVAEAQAAPAGLPPADRVLCWVMDSELAKLAPTRVRAALGPWAVSNGEPMYPLFVPAPKGAA